MFCFKCGDLLTDNDNCQNCQRYDNANSSHINSLDLSPICLGFLPSDESYGSMIMAMGQLFEDERRRFKGCWIYFCPDEFILPGGKNLELLHIHFIHERGEIRVYLSESKFLDIEEKWGRIPSHIQTQIKKYVKKRKEEILSIVKNKLRESKIII